jgi:hypothetical protein
MSGEYRVVTSHMLPTMFHHISGHFFSDQNTPWIYEYIYIRDMCGGGLCVASDDTNVSTLLTCVTADDTIVSTLLTCVVVGSVWQQMTLLCQHYWHVVVGSVWQQMTLLCQHHWHVWWWTLWRQLTLLCQHYWRVWWWTLCGDRWHYCVNITFIYEL